MAALSAHGPATQVIVAAKHTRQARLARELGAHTVVEPAELGRAVRRATGSMMIGDHLTGGADAVVDCVGSSASIDQSLAATRPGGAVVLTGMPGRVDVDLTPLWHKELSLTGAYAYGVEADGRRTFDLAEDLVRTADLGRLVTTTYPLDRYEDAIEHAAAAGPRGAVRIAFDLRDERERDHL